MQKNVSGGPRYTGTLKFYSGSLCTVLLRFRSFHLNKKQWKTVIFTPYWCIFLNINIF